LTRDERDSLVLAAVRNARPSGGGWLRSICPFCVERTGKPDRKGAFGFNSDSKVFHCFKCGYRGKLPGGKARDLPEVERPTGLETVSSYLPLWEGDGLTALVTEDARKYLEGRSIGIDMWRAASIGAAVRGAHDGRIIIPLFGDDGETWLGWVGRAWVKKAERPYLYARGMPRGVLLYNHEALLCETDDPAMVVEGVFDTFPVWPDGVAVLGKPSEPQITQLAAANRPIAVVMDGDAWMEGWALAMQLRMLGQRAGAVRLPPKKDPDEVPVSWLREEMRRCIDASPI
jgi:hypothetical protein